MKIRDIRASIEKEESTADKKTNELIKKSDTLNENLKEFKKLDSEYRKIEFRIDPTAEKKKNLILKKGAKNIKDISKLSAEISNEMKKLESLIAKTRNKIKELIKNG